MDTKSKLLPAHILTCPVNREEIERQIGLEWWRNAIIWVGLGSAALVISFLV